MVKIIPAHKRHFSDYGWLKTFWLFSFSDYYDPENIQFGALRVFNDDIVETGTGFPTHPHREMEIVTIVLSGEMTHEDSMGNKSVIKEGDVQSMSAGTGLTHSEYNLADEPVHFYQIWIYPDKSELKPSYDQRRYSPSEWKNKIFPVASGQKMPDTVTFHTDGTIYRGNFDRDLTFDFTTHNYRRIFLYITEGYLEINNVKLGSRDQARIDLEEILSFKFYENTEFILIDVPSCKGWGYDRNVLKGMRK
jgi:redox-sensitive bicupin YhaK (pirin superfamily)